MTFSQLQERLRQEILRRIDRGVLTGIMLARQTGFGQSHISNFLRRKRTLSLEGLDRILVSQSLTVSDLLPHESFPAHLSALPDSNFDAIPLVTAATALSSQNVPSHSVLDVLRIPAGILQTLQVRRANSRRHWLRFVAVRLASAQSAPMEPILTPGSIAVIDRHYNSLLRNQPDRPTLYAVRHGNTLLVRYLEFDANRLILRPCNLAYPVTLVQLGPNETASDYITGRVCFLFTQV